MRCYVDTSVLVAFYLPEAMNAQAQRLLSGAESVAISGLSEVEFHSAVARRVRMNELTRSDAVRVLSQFRLHAESGFRMVAVEQRDYLLARDWLATFSTPVRTLDALHLAVAFSNGLTVLTADRILAESAQHFGIKHKLLR